METGARQRLGDTGHGRLDARVAIGAVPVFRFGPVVVKESNEQPKNKERDNRYRRNA
jgi:hypothetical protein